MTTRGSEAAAAETTPLARRRGVIAYVAIAFGLAWAVQIALVVAARNNAGLMVLLRASTFCSSPC